MKIFLMFFLTFSSIFADFLYTKNTRCIYDLLPNQNGNGFCYRYSDSSSIQRCSTRAKITHFISGYDFNQSTGTCDLEHDLKKIGITKEQQQNLMIYIASLFSAILMFSLMGTSNNPSYSQHH